MAQQLNVDTFHLERAGATLQSVAFPAPPTRITVAGTDSVSSAINETMPVIESPVIEGLPVAKTALAKTASNIAAAARTYAETDHYLGRPVAQHEFAITDSAATSRASAGPADQQASVASADEPQNDATPDRPTSTPAPSPGDALGEEPGTVAGMAPQLSQMVGTAGTLTQNIVSGAQGVMQSKPLTDQTDGETEEQRPEEHNEGAAPGVETLDSVPAQIGADASDEQSYAKPPAAARGEQL